jgi:hypothetical protein
MTKLVVAFAILRTRLKMYPMRRSCGLVTPDLHAQLNGVRYDFSNCGT